MQHIILRVLYIKFENGTLFLKLRSVYVSVVSPTPIWQVLLLKEF